MAAVRASGLVKRFETTCAVDGVDLVVEPGEVPGLLGPNGAGKTTLLRLLFGLLTPDAGEVELLGRPLGPPDTVRLEGVGGFVEEPAFYPYLSGRVNLELLAELDGAPTSTSASARRSRVDEGRGQPPTGVGGPGPGGGGERGGDRVSGHRRQLGAEGDHGGAPEGEHHADLQQLDASAAAGAGARGPAGSQAERAAELQPPGQRASRAGRLGVHADRVHSQPGAVPFQQTPVTYDVTVQSNGCWKAQSPPSFVGQRTMRNADGAQVVNPLFVMYGCLNPL